MFLIMYTTEIVWTILVLLSLTVSSVALDEKTLFRNLFSDYETSVRPKKNPSDYITVYVNLELYQLKDIEERGQVQKVVALIDTEWKDDYLTWDPAEYNNITELIVPPDRLWLPDIGILNSADSFYQETFYTHFRAHVYNTGRIVWSFGGVMETTCSIDTTLYPFDTQTCPIVIENWAYNNNSVRLVNDSATVHMDQYSANGLWEHITSWVERKEINYQSHPEIFYPHISFFLRWKRKPRYYLVNVMLPCVFLLSIALLVFWLPPNAGEKVSLGVTILLAFSVFQFVIAENTPENSDYTPLLSTFVSLTMALSTVSVITTIVVLYLHHKPPVTKVPKLVKFVAFSVLARLLRMSMHLPNGNSNSKTRDGNRKKSTVESKQTSKQTDEDKEANIALNNLTISNNSDDIGTSGSLRDLCRQIQEITEHLKLMTSRITDREEEMNVLLEWQAVAKVIDRLLFWIVLIVLVSCSSWMLWHATK